MSTEELLKHLKIQRKRLVESLLVDNQEQLNELAVLQGAITAVEAVLAPPATGPSGKVVKGFRFAGGSSGY